ncbi:MAG: heavy metal-responsive transcriptional regulator [Zoogloeaceae bacterium]|jgi:MerR family copper efflux transcriptional regulator|nr:heavy metal-responsive transcriptional regulator [Zoogloeaceae bacterium]
MNGRENRSRHLSIGTLAKETGVSASALRYYERENLLPPPQRSAGGYRKYDKNAVWRVRFIVRAKELGFSLEEIADLLKFSVNAECAKARVGQHLTEIETRIARLESVRARLSRLMATCPRGCDPPGCCPIFSAMQAEERET